jgi:RNase P subunit RPR2
MNVETIERIEELRYEKKNLQARLEDASDSEREYLVVVLAIVKDNIASLEAGAKICAACERVIQPGNEVDHQYRDSNRGVVERWVCSQCDSNYYDEAISHLS